jgi:hypothetical protein
MWAWQPPVDVLELAEALLLARLRGPEQMGPEDYMLYPPARALQVWRIYTGEPYTISCIFHD